MKMKSEKCHIWTYWLSSTNICSLTDILRPTQIPKPNICIKSNCLGFLGLAVQESNEFFGSVTSPTFLVSLFPFMKYRNIFFKLAGAHQCIGKASNSQIVKPNQRTHPSRVPRPTPLRGFANSCRSWSAKCRWTWAFSNRHIKYHQVL